MTAEQGAAALTTIRGRSIVDDIDAAIACYIQLLDFTLETQPGCGFAMLAHGPLRLRLNTPTGGGGAAEVMPDGRNPEPGGWKRIQLPVPDLDTTGAT